MDAPRPGDAPPPYAPTQAPIGFQGPPPTMKSDFQQTPGGGQMGGQPAYMYQQQQQQQVPVQVVTTQPQVISQPVVVVAGRSCPNCRAGYLQNEFTCCGICLGVCFFPLGMICCFLMMERRCSNCSMTYGSAM